MRDWRRDAEDILQACQRVRRFIAGTCFESFAGDEQARQAVIRDLDAIGVATRNLSASAPDVVRRKLRGVPDVLAHGYADLDVRLLWSAATTRLDELEVAVRRLTS